MKRLFLLVLIFVSTAAYSQIRLTDGGKPLSRIYAADTPADKEAATLLNDFVQRISGSKLMIINDLKSVRKGDIVIGNNQVGSGVEYDLGLLTHDGFRLSSDDGYIRILSGGDKGSIYGVVTLIDDYMGVDYYAKETYTLPESKTIEIPTNIYRAENPTFRYRQSESYGLQDPIYKLWFRMDTPDEAFAGGYWVHTFAAFMPPAKYGETHPEYYAMRDGVHHPDGNHQLCLSNEGVFEIMSHVVDSIFKAHPDQRTISVSINDMEKSNCQCSECAALDSMYGGVPSGSLIWFMNRLAERFPDKEFSTLAYIFTRQAPTNIRPLPNVNIMLCNIEIDREVTMTENATGQEFMPDMNNWSAISDNIFFWDYAINFDNFVAPFPNFHILKPNMQMFLDGGTTMLHEQANGVRGGDFAELRAYVISKLMWNIDQDTDSLVRAFCDGYYGAASQYVLNYLKLMEGAVVASRLPLRIYDTPASHRDGFMHPNMIRRYNELMDKAEAAVAADPVLLERVQLSRLPLLFGELEVARTVSGYDPAHIEAMKAMFLDRTNRFGVKVLTEGNYTPAEYIDSYCTYANHFVDRPKNRAADATVTWLAKPHASYRDRADEWLTDGVYGGVSFKEKWVGWEADNGAFVLDMGDAKQVSVIEADFLQNSNRWIFAPREVKYSVSTDGTTFTEVGTVTHAEDPENIIKFQSYTCKLPDPKSVRYVKVEFLNYEISPAWAKAAIPGWAFIDEVLVY